MTFAHVKLKLVHRCFVVMSAVFLCVKYMKRRWCSIKSLTIYDGHKGFSRIQKKEMLIVVDRVPFERKLMQKAHFVVFVHIE